MQTKIYKEYYTMEKEKYCSASLEVINLEKGDIVTTSSGGGGGFDGVTDEF